MSAKASFRSSLRLLCSSGGNQVVKSSIEVKRQTQLLTKNKSFTSDGNLKLTAELRRKILTLRDVLDFSPVDGTVSTPALLTTTVEDLYKAYPEIILKLPISDIRGASTKQGLAYFWTALISIGDSWTKNQEGRANIKNITHDEHEKIDSNKLIGNVLLTLDSIIQLAKTKVDVMEVEENDWKRSTEMDTVLKKRPNETRSEESSGGSSPISPTSVLPDLRENSNDDLFGDFAIQSRDKYTLRWVKNNAKEEPPADKKVKLDLGVAVEGTYKKLSETLEVDGELNNLTRLKLQAARQWLGKSMSHPELSVLASPVQPLKLLGKPVTKIPTPQPIELPFTVSTLSTLPAPESPNPSPQIVPLPSASPPTHTDVLSISKLLPPVPPLRPPPPTPQASAIPSFLKGPPPPPPPPPSNLKAQGPPSNLRGAPPPPPPMIPLKGSSPPLPPTNGGAPPPPPPSHGGRTLGPKSAAKLKRSSQMGNLYRLLKGKVEGSSLTGKSTQGRRSQAGSGGGGGANGKQGMADALAEITKRSAYFQQIEEDTRKYAKTITELKSTITAFQTKDMAELVKFHKQVESQLENLTDESQVLARFDGFPTKKLECLRTAAALYLKLDSILTTIVNWKIVPPVSELLVKVDTYFTKIKAEVDAIERTKDEELKKFKSHNIHFDFNILVKVKESMVDLSSGCMELALKESREAKKSSNKLNSPTRKGSDGPAKMLWKAFQLAYRVYTFAGGQDDRADRLSRELAQEIETTPDADI